MAKPYLSHLKTAADLETTYEAVRTGFVALALEKNRRATPYVAQARALKEAASQASKAADLLKIFEIQPALVTAAGVSDKAIFKNPAAYIALGELKGGIDPAGADEHWKTARTSLNRIQEAFAKHKRKPHTFFVGAAIEAKMAKEILALLKRGAIENAANLTDERQIASLTRWLCSL